MEYKIHVGDVFGGRIESRMGREARSREFNAISIKIHLGEFNPMLGFQRRRIECKKILILVWLNAKSMGKGNMIIHGQRQHDRKVEGMYFAR